MTSPSQPALHPGLAANPQPTEKEGATPMLVPPQLTGGRGRERSGATFFVKPPSQEAGSAYSVEMDDDERAHLRSCAVSAREWAAEEAVAGNHERAEALLADAIEFARRALAP